MEHLEFTKEGNSFVTAPLTPNDDGIVAFQLGFKDDGARLIVEVKIDESLPWAKKAIIPMPSSPDTYYDKITGISDGDIVRLRVNVKPDISVIV